MLRLLIFSAMIWASSAMAQGRYGLAPVEQANAVQVWVSQDSDRYWIKGEKQIFYYDPGQSLGHLPFGTGHWKPLPGELYYYYGAHDLPKGSEELLHGGRIRLIQSPEALPIDFASDNHGGVRPLMKNHSLSDQQTKPFKFRQTISLSDSLDGESWFRDLEALSGWNRYTYGTEIEMARLYLASEFEKLPGFVLENFNFEMPRGPATNLIARIEGKSRPDEVYIVGAHYDSTSESPSTSAPGAEDNASGTAGLLALARLFAQYPPEATIIFVAFSGEEQGLYGSKAWLKNYWMKNNLQDQIKAALIMDMIGYSGDDELDLLLETSRLTKPLLADIQSVNTDPELVVSESFNYWGSDHEPFLDNDVPAILFIENDYLRYPAYHRKTDVFANIHPTLGPKVLALMADSLSLWVY